MEVHHHSHTARKKWTHYFWEFLMLFLAVFCGFLAEYKLEHTIEHQREKQYMNSLISDLKADTNMLNNGILRKIDRVSAIDSVFVFFYNNKNVQKISGKAYKILRRTTFDQRLVRSTITINQLKNAGGMRLVRNRQVADSIAAYDFNCERYNPYNENYLSHQQLNYRHFEKMVVISDILPLYVENRSIAITTNIPDNIDIKVNTTGINDYMGLLMQTKIFALQEILEFKRLKNSAVNLITLIKKEYHLK